MYKIFSRSYKTFNQYRPLFESGGWKKFELRDKENNKFYIALGLSGLTINFHKYPACDQVTIDMLVKGSQFADYI